MTDNIKPVSGELKCKWRREDEPTPIEWIGGFTETRATPDPINWMVHDGSDKCPVPEGVRWACKLRSGQICKNSVIDSPCAWGWQHDDETWDITHYWYEGCEADKPKNSWEGRFQERTCDGYEWFISEEFEGRYWGRVKAGIGGYWIPTCWSVTTGKDIDSSACDLLPIEPPKPVEVVRYAHYSAPTAEQGYATLEEANKKLGSALPGIRTFKHVFRDGKLVSVELVNEEDES